MRECFIVVHQNYAEGISAYAFWNEADAKKCVSEEVEVDVKSLIESGYEPVTLDRGFGDFEVYVPDSDISYQWNIVPSDIR